MDVRLMRPNMASHQVYIQLNWCFPERLPIGAHDDFRLAQSQRWLNPCVALAVSARGLQPLCQSPPSAFQAFLAHIETRCQSDLWCLLVLCWPSSQEPHKFPGSQIRNLPGA